MEILQLIESIASNVTAQNIDSFVQLVEKLVALAESVKPVNPPSANS
jgi:hypothetical protein